MPPTPDTASTLPQSPSPDELEDVLLDCRYGDIDSVKAFVQAYGVGALASAHDERGNGVLHMCAANGHDVLLEYILSLPDLPSSLLASRNDAGNTPLHWACLNAQLGCTKLLVSFRPSQTNGRPHAENPLDGPETTNASPSSDLGPALILACNNAGQTPLGEAERGGWDEGARWLVSAMDLSLASSTSSAISETEVEAEADADTADDLASTNPDKSDSSPHVEVESNMERLRLSESKPHS